MVELLKMLGKSATPYLLMAVGASLAGTGYAIFQWGKAECQQELISQQNALQELRQRYEREKSAEEVRYAANATREYTRLEGDVQKLQKALKNSGKCSIDVESAKLLQYFVEASRNPEG